MFGVTKTHPFDAWKRRNPAIKLSRSLRYITLFSSTAAVFVSILYMIIVLYNTGRHSPVVRLYELSVYIELVFKFSKWLSLRTRAFF